MLIEYEEINKKKLKIYSYLTLTLIQMELFLFKRFCTLANIINTNIRVWISTSIKTKITTNLNLPI